MHHERDEVRDPVIRRADWNRKVDGLRRRIARLAGGTRRRLEQRLQQVCTKRSTLDRRLKEAAHGTRLAWEDVRDDLAETRRDVQDLSREVRDEARER
jgi:hypothetical protein